MIIVLFYDFGRDSGYDGVGRYVFHNDSIWCHYRIIANTYLPNHFTSDSKFHIVANNSYLTIVVFTANNNT